MSRWRKCLVSICCKHRQSKAAEISHDHPCNVFLPAAVARDHAIEMAYAAAETAQHSAANAQRVVNQIVDFRSAATKVFEEAAKHAQDKEARNSTLKCADSSFKGFTMFEMSRISRELVRANSA